MQRWGAASVLASRFVAGATAEEAVACAAALHAKHSICGSLFYLGEYVDRIFRFAGQSPQADEPAPLNVP
jgi:hypothetical protein